MAGVGSLRENLARNLKIRRGLHKLSQAQLAERAGLSPGYIGNLETARNWPSDDKAEKIAQALDMDCGMLFMNPDSDVAQYDRQDIEQALQRYKDHVMAELNRPYAPSRSGDDR